MRQKDVDRIASILQVEMDFAHESEVEGLKAAIGAIRASVGWAQPELDMSGLERALETIPPVRLPRSASSDESHIIRGID